MQWYEDQARYHPNWTVLKQYIDRGITGTQAKKRPAFIEMLEDDKHHKFDLIVTREVCRFARNTVDTLVITRQLKEMGIEVYFVEDNIWTMDNDGELRLTIMATLAQEESRKTSERVRAGQKISRDNGVLYGNGNILGYDRVGGTYVINEEQAETVRIIYDLYLKGLGFNRIVNELIRLKRKDSSGQVRWEATKVCRILHNATYKGYQGYYKSYKNNHLEQKTVINRDEDTYLYVKGDFEPIISEEQWERCKQIRLQRTRYSKFRTENGEVLHKTGIHESSDVWTKKLKCRCGYKMRKNKWRKNKNGEVIYGYKCYNQLNYGSKDVRIEAGIDDSKSCNLREICDWKLEMMARHIFAGLWGNKKDILNNVSSLYQIGVFQEYQKAAEIKATVDKEIAKLDEKLKRLTRMRLEDEIPKESYLELKKEIEQEKIELINKRRILDAGMVPNEDGEEEPAKKVEDFLLSKMDFTEHYVDREVIKQFVHTIVPVTETSFNWYMNFDLIDVPNDMKKLVWEFTIDYKSARSYRKEKDGMLRPNQWQDLTVKVFI
jgi:DNA invertase Pin-like site-specific DNA recombinase